VKRLLLDECIPRKFKNHLPGHDCLTVPDAGWAGKKNGELLSLAENAGFQVFVSLDQGTERTMGTDESDPNCYRRVSRDS
jgi:hypothetical protein